MSLQLASPYDIGTFYRKKELENHTHNFLPWRSVQFHFRRHITRKVLLHLFHLPDFLRSYSNCPKLPHVIDVWNTSVLTITCTCDLIIMVATRTSFEYRREGILTTVFRRGRAEIIFQFIVLIAGYLSLVFKWKFSWAFQHHNFIMISNRAYVIFIKKRFMLCHFNCWIVFTLFLSCIVFRTVNWGKEQSDDL